jgi:ATP-dependent Zn protease
MSEKIGRVAYGGDEREVFLGRDFGREKNYSEKTAEAIDVEVKRFIEAAYKQAKVLLTANKKKLDLLAKTLLEKEVIEGDELDALLGIKSTRKPKAPIVTVVGGDGPTKPTATAPLINPAPSPA